VTTSETEIKLFQPLTGVLKLFQNYLSDNEHVGKYSRAAISLWNNVRQNYFRWVLTKAGIILK